MVNLKLNNQSGVVQTIRQLTIEEWAELITCEIAAMIDRKSRNCTNCTHFDADTQHCSLVNQIPPPYIAVKGCEKWQEEIPF